MARNFTPETDPTMDNPLNGFEVFPGPHVTDSVAGVLRTDPQALLHPDGQRLATENLLEEMNDRRQPTKAQEIRPVLGYQKPELLTCGDCDSLIEIITNPVYHNVVLAVPFLKYIADIWRTIRNESIKDIIRATSRMN